MTLLTEQRWIVQRMARPQVLLPSRLAAKLPAVAVVQERRAQ
ncbi:MAG TPA: hypothetical protein VJ723_01550 [Candidatus Angelobacter sp.]|nr:hypothetical protein [Candidatus Angelobacter sp.]